MIDSLRERLAQALGSQYTLTRELGGGGMSRVFVARDVQLDRDVVVKVLSTDLAQELSGERFTREIRLAAALQHAHIVPLLTAGVTSDGVPYYTMPYVEGESLRHRLRGGEPLPMADVLVVLRDVARALAYAHARGVVHRDIKPDNVLLSGGAAVVTDFGIAKALTSARAEAQDMATGEALTRLGTSLGTPSYMAPEQGTGDPDTDHRADVYAFGAMAYELLAGAPPFGTRSAHALLIAHLTEAPAPVQQRRPDAPEGLAALVMRCLAKAPAERPQSASEVLAALDALGGSGSNTVPTGATLAVSRPRRRRALVVAGVVALLLVAAAIAALRVSRRPPGLDATRLAVMPFDVRDSSLAVWREGMVDVLSRSLDGAGPLRTVAPSTAIAQGGGRADEVGAAALGRAVGAGLVLLGSIDRAAGDSVHVRAALVDVADGRARAPIEFQADGARMDAVADTLAMRVLRELGTSGGLGGTRLYSIGTRSLPALRAFLQGQAYYRRALSDSAELAFRSAVEQDSTFALAWRALSALYVRTGREGQPQAVQALDNAIRHKSGRSPRDSLLLRADSLRRAVAGRSPGRQDMLEEIPTLTELFATLGHAAQQYPTDAELWFELGDAGFHFGEFAGVAQGDALAAFERSVALDSAFVIPYVHAFALALRQGRVSAAAAHAARMAALLPAESAPYYRLTAAVLAAPAPFSPEARRLLDSLPARHAAFVLNQLATSPDTAATALQLARALRERPSPTPEAADSTALADAIARALAARGRFAEVRERQLWTLPPALLLQLALLDAVPSDSVADRAARWLRSDPARAVGAMRLWADRRDTASLARLQRWADSAAAQSAAAGAARPPVPSAAVAAYAALARSDTAAALELFLGVPMSLCGSPCAGGTVARLLADAGRAKDAARVLDRWLPSVSTNVALPPSLLLRAQLAEELGDERRAIEAYRSVAVLWAGGDPETRPAVAAAEAALRRLRAR